MAPTTRYVYLDHNATSPIRPEVVAVMQQIYEKPYNASSIHALGREAKAFLSRARSILAEHMACEEENIFFTSGGTESNNIVLRSGWEQIFCSSTEHDSIYQGPLTKSVPVLSSGILDLEALENFLKESPSKKTLVSVHWANNETGVIQPIQKIIEIVRRYGAFLHVDGVQVLGKMSFSFHESDIDFLSLSAHKMGGPQGVGALVIKKGLTLAPLFVGGGQEKFLRAGTENIAGIVGFGEAVRHLDFTAFDLLRKQHHLLEQELLAFSKKHDKPILVIGSTENRLPNTTCFSTPGLSNQSQLIYFDLKGIGVSIGSACSSRTVKPSRVLKNMGFSEEVIHSSIRVSSGWNTTESDFSKFKEAWKELFLKNS